MNVKTPEVELSGQRMVPVVLDAGDDLEREVIESDNNQCPQVQENQAIEHQQDLVLKPPKGMAPQLGVKRGRGRLAIVALPEVRLSLSCGCAHRSAEARLRDSPDRQGWMGLAQTRSIGMPPAPE